jgi:hypothetical protein
MLASKTDDASPGTKAIKHMQARAQSRAACWYLNFCSSHPIPVQNTGSVVVTRLNPGCFYRPRLWKVTESCACCQHSLTEPTGVTMTWHWPLQKQRAVQTHHAAALLLLSMETRCQRPVSNTALQQSISISVLRVEHWRGWRVRLLHPTGMQAYAEIKDSLGNTRLAAAGWQLVTLVAFRNNGVAIQILIAVAQ